MDNDPGADAGQESQAYETETASRVESTPRDEDFDEDSLDSEESDGPMKAFDVNELRGSIGS